MEEVALSDAIHRLDAALRRLPFSPKFYQFSERQMSLSHPTDNEGGVDTEYLVVTFGSDLPPYWMHRKACSRDYYLGAVKRENIQAGIIAEWTSCIELNQKNSAFRWLNDFLANLLRRWKSRANAVRRG